MSDYLLALSYAVPAFLLLIVVEYAASVIKGQRVYRGADTIASLSSGLTNVLKDVLGLAVVIVSYDWMVSRFALFTIESTLWLYVAAFICKDFAAYWSHRIEHRVNALWNRHLMHHSSEEFNLACALRQSISPVFLIFFFLYLPMAMMGIPTEVVAVIAPIHLFLQFWYHTQLINRMGFLEHIIVTPSMHRVHHAINDEYIDKNFAAIFVIWDKLFGTFQPELEHVRPVYGIKRPARTWNPVLINFKHIYQIARDAWSTRSWVDKLRIWFMPTGWRPADVRATHPIYSISDVYQYQKYATVTPTPLLLWSAFQLFVSYSLMMHLFSRLPDHEYWQILLGALFLLLNVCAYTSLLDRSKLALGLEVPKVAIASGLLLLGDGWFGLDQRFSLSTELFMAYLLMSVVITLYYVRSDTSGTDGFVSDQPLDA